MRRSFVRLTINSVLVCWAASFVVLVLHSSQYSWIDSRARGDGIFLAYQLLEETPVARRPARLKELEPHYSVRLSLASLDEVERHVGRRPSPGDQLPLRKSKREEWYFLAFQDGQGALAVGPVNPMAPPPGFLPIGLILVIIGLPFIAGLVALRVERELTKVERASQALAVGELSARVDNQHGPSNELAATFNAMAERVERLVRSRDELVQAVSHELGAPLARLRFHIELLDKASEAQRRERQDAIERELDALDELVAELLGYVQSDELKVDRQAFSPQKILTDLAELARLEADIEVDLELDHSAIVFADQRLFQRAVENILRNAVRYAHGQILLELTVEEAQVRVAIHDDGPGIPDAQREKVIAPFFRLEADRARKTGGVGLGLAIVSRIMQRHNGSIEISAAPLGGAKVTTIWPCAGRRSQPGSAKVLGGKLQLKDSPLS